MRASTANAPSFAGNSVLTRNLKQLTGNRLTHATPAATAFLQTGCFPGGRGYLGRSASADTSSSTARPQTSAGVVSGGYSGKSFSGHSYYGLKGGRFSSATLNEHLHQIGQIPGIRGLEMQGNRFFSEDISMIDNHFVLRLT